MFGLLLVQMSNWILRVVNVVAEVAVGWLLAMSVLCMGWTSAACTIASDLSESCDRS